MEQGTSESRDPREELERVISATQQRIEKLKDELLKEYGKISVEEFIGKVAGYIDEIEERKKLTERRRDFI